MNRQPPVDHGPGAGHRLSRHLHASDQAGYSRKTARTGAVTLIQRFGRSGAPGALNLNIHFHMMFLDGVYIDRHDESVRFRWISAPTVWELTQLSQTIARRVGRYLERQGLLERDAENNYLALEAASEDTMAQLLGHSITYRIAVGPQAGRKMFTLQTLPACEPDDYADKADKVSGLSLHASVAALIPRPRANLTRFHGVFVGVPHQLNSKCRAFMPLGYW